MGAHRAFQPERIRRQWAACHPEMDTSPMEVVALLKRAMALLGQAVEPLYEGAPLTMAEMEILVPLRHAEAPLIASRVASACELSRAGASKVLAKLERRGLLTRSPNPADRRSSLIALTEQGAAAADSLFPRQLDVERVLLGPLGERRPAVIAALRQLVDAMEEGFEEADEEAARSAAATGRRVGDG